MEDILFTEQKFNLSETLDELQAILEKEFKLSPDVAQIAVAIFVYEQSKDEDNRQNMEDTLWFLNANKDEYQSHIFSTRYTISFSQAMLNVLDDFIVSMLLNIRNDGKSVIWEAVLCSIKALVKNLRRVEDNECCVYFQVLQYIRKHSNKWFSVEDATPKIGTESLCINLNKKWQCKFRCNKNCNIQSNDVKDILEKFCTDNVMEMNEENLSYRFKIKKEILMEKMNANSEIKKSIDEQTNDNLSESFFMVSSEDEIPFYVAGILDISDDVFKKGADFLKKNRSFAILADVFFSVLSYVKSHNRSAFTFMLEENYVDMVYRDSYYFYFSGKHFCYDRFCKRIFFIC